jgi:hypothetical protein
MRSFGCINVGDVKDGKASISQNHFVLSVDDLGEEFRSSEQVRKSSIIVSKDSTRESLFDQLNVEKRYVITENGSLELSLAKPLAEPANMVIEFE